MLYLHKIFTIRKLENNGQAEINNERILFEIDTLSCNSSCNIWLIVYWIIFDLSVREDALILLFVLPLFVHIWSIYMFKKYYQMHFMYAVVLRHVSMTANQIQMSI